MTFHLHLVSNKQNQTNKSPRRRLTRQTCIEDFNCLWKCYIEICAHVHTFMCCHSRQHAEKNSQMWGDPSGRWQAFVLTVHHHIKATFQVFVSVLMWAQSSFIRRVNLRLKPLYVFQYFTFDLSPQKCLHIINSISVNFEDEDIQ